MSDKNSSAADDGLRKKNDDYRRDDDLRVAGSIPKKRQELLNWNGWGFKDSGFIGYSEDNEHVKFRFAGDRYELGGNDLPYFADFLENTFKLNFRRDRFVQVEPAYPDPLICQAFLDELPTSITRSVEGMDRLFRSHGHTLHDVYHMKTASFGRIPDVVVWPECHKDVEEIISLAVKHNVAVIPFGGGTNVTGAVQCPEEEHRMIVSLDTSQMNQILWIDEEGLCAHIEAGIIGKDMENRLMAKGFTTGHEPDSYEFSSLGGWVATRASGMKKNRYGNIEDLLISLRAVTPQGEWHSSGQFPRVSTGPDMNHILLGSEGTLAVITEVTIKIRPLPPVRKYGSYVFPEFELGVNFMRHVARDRCQPASLRLMDNEQFVFGQALKTSSGYLSYLANAISHFYLTRIKGFDMSKICVATVVTEGTAEEVAAQEAKIHSIAVKYQGMAAGGNNGKRGYQLTFAIAYIRDLGFDYGVIGESFETSAPWDRVSNVIKNTKYRLELECINRKFPGYFISARVTQVYDAGACIYFYFAFNYGSMDVSDAVDAYGEIEIIARDEIMTSGGSLSHHHGVGKIRKRWMKSVLTPSAFRVLEAIKESVDPKNIMATRNLIF